MSGDRASLAFDCFGGVCAVQVEGAGPLGTPPEAAAAARERLLAAHERFTRFEAGSELSRLNADPRAVVPVGAELARFAAAALEAARRSGGLVDPTLLRPLVEAGYARDVATPVPLAFALAHAPARTPARPHPAQRWREAAVEPRTASVSRPPGLALDSGGIVKGLLADELAAELAGHARFAVDCAGDLHVGGAARARRPVGVESPFDGRVLHVFALRDGGIATSGIGRRSWLDADGRPAHHLLDPASGRPAFTGIVQVTALAPTAFEAEWRAKAALLSGPARAVRWLQHGGLVVHDDGSHDVLEPPRERAAPPARRSGRTLRVRLPGSATHTVLSGSSQLHRR